MQAQSSHFPRMIGLVALFALVGCSQDPENLVFILAGQSNMEGYGNSSELSDTHKALPPNVTYLKNGQLSDFTAHERFGPEVGFAHEMSRHFPQQSITLIKFAVGGTSLLAWAPQWLEENAELTGNGGAGPLYERLFGFIAQVDSNNAADFAGVLWMQGERDARFANVGSQYADNFRGLIEQIRLDLGRPDLPFFYGQVNPPVQRYPAVTEVRQAQSDSQRMISGLKMVLTDGLSKLEDNLHYDTEGQLELGRRFAEAYLNFNQTGP